MAPLLHARGHGWLLPVSYSMDIPSTEIAARHAIMYARNDEQLLFNAVLFRTILTWVG